MRNARMLSGRRVATVRAEGRRTGRTGGGGSAGYATRTRLLVAALLVAVGIGAVAIPARAASIDYPQSTTYGDHVGLTVSGLRPNTPYWLRIYGPYGHPFSFTPFTSDAAGTFSLPRFGPSQTVRPGTYIFAIETEEMDRTVASITTTLTGTNTYYRAGRLGG